MRAGIVLGGGGSGGGEGREGWLLLLLAADGTVAAVMVAVAAAASPGWCPRGSSRMCDGHSRGRGSGRGGCGCCCCCCCSHRLRRQLLPGREGGGGSGYVDCHADVGGVRCVAVGGIGGVGGVAAVLLVVSSSAPVGRLRFLAALLGMPEHRVPVKVLSAEVDVLGVGGVDRSGIGGRLFALLLKKKKVKMTHNCIFLILCSYPHWWIRQPASATDAGGGRGGGVPLVWRR